MIIAIDFDGTVVDHRYPDIGEEAPQAVETLRFLLELGHKLILFTMRSGSKLGDAVAWFENRNIKLWGVQYNPEQVAWSASNKCYAEMYIDDAAFGAPLIKPFNFARPCVHWFAVKEYFKLQQYLESHPVEIIK